jgi:CHASE2 domain-containing sensor protein
MTRRLWPYVFEAYKALPGVLLVLLVAVINPFGIRSATDQASTEIFQKLTADLYPGAGQEKIAVVLIDDRSLQVLGEKFPPDFTFYSRLIGNMAAAGIESAFLDLNIVDPRGDPSDLENFASVLRGLPVFLAATADESTARDCGGIRVRNLPQLREAVVSEPHPMIRDDARHIDLLLEDACTRFRPAAALSVYAHHCSRLAGCPGSRMDPVSEPAGFEGRDMSIEWGSVWPAGAEAIHPSYRDLSSLCPRADWSSRASRFLHVLFPFLDDAGNGTFAQGCSYHPMIRAEWLLSPDETGADADAVFDILAGRIVLVGANFTGQNDIGPSPVFGDIPGVFIHAMALDNLIVHGTGFLSVWPEGGVGGLGFNDMVELGLTLAFTLLGYWLGRFVSPKSIRWGLPWMLALMLGGAAAGLLITWVLVWGLRLEPINWIGVLLACTAIATPARSLVGNAWAAFCSREKEGVRQEGGDLLSKGRKH